MDWIWWLVLALALIGVEMLTMGFFVACFGVGALPASLVSFLGGGVGLQLTAFALGSLAAIVWVRPLFLKTSAPSMKTNTDAYLGRSGKVIETVAPGAGGKVALGGEIWRARPCGQEAIPAGTMVTVERIDGLAFIVKPLDSLSKEPCQ